MSVHFIRIWFLLGLIPTIMCMLYIKKRRFVASSWQAVCDPNLLNALLKQKNTPWFYNPLYLPLWALFFVFIAASGPAFNKILVNTYKAPYPKMILVSLSKSMLAQDVSPSRMIRAKFIIQDLLNSPNIEPVGLLAYTSEPFSVSPLTDDTATIKALLPSLDTDTPPVDGENLAAALLYAAKTIQKANFKAGSILVLTSTPPDDDAIATAADLSKQGFNISIMPIKRPTKSLKSFNLFAKASNGYVLPLAKAQIQNWLKKTAINSNLIADSRYLTKWEDRGRLFILPDILLLLPLFQRARLQGI